MAVDVVLQTTLSDIRLTPAVALLYIYICACLLCGILFYEYVHIKIYIYIVLYSRNSKMQASTESNICHP